MVKCNKCDVCAQSIPFGWSNQCYVLTYGDSIYKICPWCSNQLYQTPDGELLRALIKNGQEELAERVFIDWALNIGTARLSRRFKGTSQWGRGKPLYEWWLSDGTRKTTHG